MDLELLDFWREGTKPSILDNNCKPDITVLHSNFSYQFTLSFLKTMTSAK